MNTITIEVDKDNLSFIKTLLENLKGVKNITVQENDNPYNPDFVKSVQEGREEYNRGETKAVSTEDLWK